MTLTLCPLCGEPRDECGCFTCIYCQTDQWTSSAAVNWDEHDSGVLPAVPEVSDDSGWQALGQSHEPWCEWVLTRAHQLHDDKCNLVADVK